MNMNVQSVFGQLLSSVSKSLWLLLKKPLVKTVNEGTVLVWDVLEGPYLRDEFDEDDLHADGIPIGLDAMLVVLVQEGDEMDTVDFWYDTEEDALEVIKFFKAKIGPLEVK